MRGLPSLGDPSLGAELPRPRRAWQVFERWRERRAWQVLERWRERWRVGPGMVNKKRRWSAVVGAACSRAPVAVAGRPTNLSALEHRATQRRSRARREAVEARAMPRGRCEHAAARTHRARGPPLSRGGLRRGRGALARQRACVAGDGLRLRDRQREGQPPQLGWGSGVAEPGRRARRRAGSRRRPGSRAACAAGWALDQPGVLGGEAQPVARAGRLDIPRAW